MIRNMCIIVCMFSLGGCVHSSKQDQDTSAVNAFSLEQHEVITKSTRHQTVLPGFFLGNATAEIAVLSVVENHEHHLQIFAFEHETWSSKFETTLQPEVLFVDTANFGGQDRLILYKPGSVNWFDPSSKSVKPLLETAFNYKADKDDGIPHVDITRDLNHDGLDDLVMPDTNGFWISTQLQDGSFSGPVKIGPPEPFLNDSAFDDSRSYREVGINSQTTPWYLSRIYEMDYNRDDRSDLVFWNQDHFEVYLQDQHGTFSHEAKTFATEAPFGSDGVYSFLFGFSGENMFTLITGLKKKTKLTVLHSMRDMNNDNVTDLVTQSLEGRSALRLRSWFDVHFGTATKEGITFEKDASMRLQPRKNARGKSPLGYSLGWMQDFDGDGHVDFIFGRVNTGVIGFFRAILANSISINIEYYRIKDGVVPEKPNGSLHVKPDLDFLGKRGPFFPTVLLGDINSDGYSDLLVGKNWKKLNIYKGLPDQNVFSNTPQKFSVALPANEKDARLVDLNKDGKQDILIHHKSTKPNRVIIQISH